MSHSYFIYFTNAFLCLINESFVFYKRVFLFNQFVIRKFAQSSICRLHKLSHQLFLLTYLRSEMINRLVITLYIRSYCLSICIYILQSFVYDHMISHDLRTFISSMMSRSDERIKMIFKSMII